MVAGFYIGGQSFLGKFDYSIATNSGTSTLHSILEAKRFKPGSEVIVPALSVIMNTTSVVHANLIPIYADIEPETFLINPDDVEAKVVENCCSCCCFSLRSSPQFLKLRQICGYSLLLIEDNAQSISALSADGLRVSVLVMFSVIRKY